MAELRDLVEVLAHHSAGLLKAADEIPKGAEYTRRYALNSALKNKVVDLGGRIRSLSMRLLLISGLTIANNGDEDLMEKLLEGVSLCLRRGDRALKLIPSDRQPSRKRKSPDSQVDGSIEQCILALNPVKRSVALSAENSEGKACRVDSLNMKGGEGASSHLFLRKKNNFEWVYRSLLSSKVHELVGYNGTGENKLRFATNESRVQFIKLVSELPREDCQSNSIECLERFHESIQRMEGEGFLTDEFGSPSVAIPNPYQSELEALSAYISKWGCSQGTPSAYDDPWGYNCGARLFQLLFTVQEPVKYKSIENSPVVKFISCREDLEAFCTHVLSEGIDMVGIDVESHFNFSYRGYSCLIQLSTIHQDYLIDPSTIPASDLGILNDVFCCPSVLKILHGGHYDVQWLQTDFGIYFVNLFDTFFASKVLEIPGGNSLANLVNHYCDVRLDKKFQLSDWRVRPLTGDQIRYARSDSHYLIYIFQSMRNQILSDSSDPILKGSRVYDVSMKATARGKKLLLAVFEQSKQLCLQKISYLPKSFHFLTQKIVARSGMSATQSTLELVRYLLLWRDLEARKRDMAPHNLLSDSNLFQIARKCPRTLEDMQSVLREMNCDGCRMDVSALSNLLAVVTSAIQRISPEAFKTMVNPANSTPVSGLLRTNSSSWVHERTKPVTADGKNFILPMNKAMKIVENAKIGVSKRIVHSKKVSQKASAKSNFLIIRGSYRVKQGLGSKSSSVIKSFKRIVSLPTASELNQATP